MYLFWGDSCYPPVSKIVHVLTYLVNTSEPKA